MQHKNTGRNYLMVVNNSFTDRANIALRLNGAVSSLELAGTSDAGTSTWSLENDILSIQADIGGAYLFALPEGVDFVQSAEQPGEQDNVALSSYITASSSQSSDQYFIKNLIDGERASTASSRGWRTDDVNASITFDFGTPATFNRIDLYPSEIAGVYGGEMPTGFVLEASDDKESWTPITEVTDYIQGDYIPPTWSFGETHTAICAYASQAPTPRG